MAEPLALYPLASIAGQAIPYEVIRSIGLIRQDFEDVASSAVNIPANADILSLYASADCLIRFDGIVEVPVNGALITNTMVIAGNTYINIDHNGASTFTVIGLRDPGGTLFVNAVQKWTDIHKPIRVRRN
jgi:hypothetical protein